MSDVYVSAHTRNGYDVSSYTRSSPGGGSSSSGDGLRKELEDIFDGKTPYQSKDMKTGKMVDKYAKWNDDKEELEEYTPIEPRAKKADYEYYADKYGLGETSPTMKIGKNIDIKDSLEIAKNIGKMFVNNLHTIVRDSFVDDDLRSGDVYEVVNQEPANWIYGGSSPAHNIGTEGNVEYRGKIDTIREGQQIILDKNRNIVTNPINGGTFDFVSPEDNMLSHFSVDVVPWLIYGNGVGDTTTFEKRLRSFFHGLRNKLEK